MNDRLISFFIIHIYQARPNRGSRATVGSKGLLFGFWIMTLLQKCDNLILIGFQKNIKKFMNNEILYPMHRLYYCYTIHGIETVIHSFRCKEIS